MSAIDLALFRLVMSDHIATECGARLANGKTCKARPAQLFGRRCRLHGGASTGPKTQEGRDRIAAAQRERWRAWRSERGITEHVKQCRVISTNKDASRPSEIQDEWFQNPAIGGVTIVEDENGAWRVHAEVWPEGNKRARIARMRRIAENMKWGGWKCRHCGAPVPEYRRADAKYCRTACRKAAHRERAKWRAE